MPTKKTKKPVPPKITRMDIVLDPSRQQVLNQLCEITGVKTNTKALFLAADFYLNEKNSLQNTIKDQANEISKLKTDLKKAINVCSNFISSLNDLKSFWSDNVPNPDNFNTVDFICPECNHSCNSDDIENGFCPECDNEID